MPSFVLFALFFLLGSFPQQAPVPAPGAPASPNSQIAGIVVDAFSGQPLSHAEVSIQSQTRANTGQTVTTGDDGLFLFDNVAPGQYPLTASRRGYVQQAYKQHEFFSTAIIVGPGLDTSHLRFPLPPDASISGKVLDELNDPVRIAQVLLFQQGLQLGRHTMWQQSNASTDDQGHYRFGHLLPGTYFVAVSAQPWYAQHVTHQLLTRTDPSGAISEQEMTTGEPELDVVYPITFFSNAGDVSGAEPITLHSGDAETADFTLHPAPGLHVIVNYPPSAKADEPENLWPVVSQELIPGIQQNLGTVQGQQRPGVLEVTGLSPGHLNLSLRSAHGEETHSLSMQLAADASINISDIAPPGSLSGVVKMDDGSRATHIAVEFRDPATGEQFGAHAKDTGEYMWQGPLLASRTYEVLVRGPGAEAVRSLSATGAKVSGRTIEVVAGQDVKLTIIVSKGTGRVSGVALKEGKPIEAVMVVLVPEIPVHNLELYRRDQSDSDGSFTLSGVLPGKYTVIALENGWDLDWYTPAVLQKYLPGGERVEVSPNAKLDVKVKVQP